MSTIPVATKRSQRSVKVASRKSWATALGPLSSLKLTVIGFAFSIVLILIGTLAQAHKDIWEVLETFFKPWIARVEVSILFPPAWFPQLEPASAARMFAMGIMVMAAIAAGMTFANRRYVSSAIPIAGATFLLALLVSISALLYGSFLFPGGALIGSILALNLLTAHLVRFKIQARGRAFWVGLALTTLGIALTVLIIVSGHNSEGFQGEPPFAWRTLWSWVKVGLTITGLAFIGGATFVSNKIAARHIRIACLITGIATLVLAIWLWASGERAYLGDSGMRVLWQLILGSVAGGALLLGSIPLFGRRAGIVVLHAGVGLMMFGQWFVSYYDVEQQITMAEGQTVNFAQDIRSIELAVIDPESEQFSGKDDVFAIPLTRNGYPTDFVSSEKITDPRLPFEIDVVQFLPSSLVKMSSPVGHAETGNEEENPATAGSGLQFEAVAVQGATGAAGSEVNLASGYFRLATPDGEELGTYMLSQDQLRMRDGKITSFDTETVEVDGRQYLLQLRFQREYKDYALTLQDVRKDDYLGTSIPRNYSSEVRLVDQSRGVDRMVSIWMNNPRRYAGETFYQSGYQTDPFGNEYTTLQVVRNHGWMIPYVACMICLAGLLYHFSRVLNRFITNRGAVIAETPSDDTASQTQLSTRGAGILRDWAVPAVAVALTLFAMVRLSAAPPTPVDGFDIHRFGKLPIVYQGRVKPFDTLARNSLQIVSDYETFNGVLPPNELQAKWSDIETELKQEYPELSDEDLQPYRDGDIDGLIELIVKQADEDPYAVTKVVQDLTYDRQPAIRWLLDLISGHPNSRRHKVLRIYHPGVLDVFGLKRRKGYHYSLEELAPKMDAFQEQVSQAANLQSENSSELELYHRKLLQLDQRMRSIVMLHRSFTPPPLPQLPSADEFQNDHTAAMRKLESFRNAVFANNSALKEAQVPLAVAPDEPDEPWQAYAAAWPMQFVQTRLVGEAPQPSFGALNQMLVAYVDGQPDQFNTAVKQYEKQLQRDPPKELNVSPNAANDYVASTWGTFYSFEAVFNRTAPFFWCSVFYVLAFVLLCFSWLVWPKTLGRTAYTLLWMTFIIHSLALLARIYISGRPPVTNLYSSAVFIGWGAVLLALIIEMFYRNGLASVIAAVTGFSTLVVAHKLAADGDTFQVLQAVLDTQFWLATHVVCITLGYATTFLAGGLGLLYILRGVLTPTLNDRVGRDLVRMIYGTLCFAIIFSFIGTVLGGLWADDSWGRFWGWDPKENGALIIVLWNALILHARWGGILRQRGIAVLAVAGNIVTIWSWFGVNELGEGLHSYGFTEGRLMAIAYAVLFHMGLVLIGWMPLSLWWSRRAQENDRLGV